MKKHMRMGFSTMLLLLAASAGLGGCVERRVTIGSDPPGALLIMNDVEVGRTPITVPYKWQGDYDLRFRLDQNVGTPEDPRVKRYYLHTNKKTTSPWFDVVPFDLFAELLPIPFKHDEVWAFPIPEVTEPTDAELIERARILKGEVAPGK